ncbi:psd-1 [Pristionchus pacificus]|nr:psd-1 [Pristionchus pacificus]
MRSSPGLQRSEERDCTRDACPRPTGAPSSTHSTTMRTGSSSDEAASTSREVLEPLNGPEQEPANDPESENRTVPGGTEEPEEGARKERRRRRLIRRLQMRTYFSLPLNVVSRLAGGIASKEIPMSLRRPLLGLFAKVYDCRMDEAVQPDFESYSSFSAFFNRTLRPDARPISATPLVSPADGIVLHYGKIEDDKVEFVKGHDYNVKEFLGDVEIKPKAGHDLYQLVVYLAPGNYHAFHSPAKWSAEHIRHYPGLLLSVRPALLNRVPHLFCLNERVILNGSWRHGFFSMAAVAATNVGDIAIDADASIRTNISRRRAARAESVRTECALSFAAGERVGEFRLGSTIVLIFQAPSNVKFAVQAGDALRYGQSLIVDDM